MYKKAFIINNDGKIFIFPKNIDLSENELEQLESKLRQFTTSINYSDEIHEFNFDIYSIWSLIVMGEEMLDDFISFLENNSVNEFPKILKDKIKIQKENFKQVLLEENLENIIINVLNGDLESIIKKYFDKEVKSTSNPKVYTSTKDNYNTITKKLLKHNVSIKLDNYLEDVESINLDFRCTFTLRYYESEALNLILNRKQKNGVIFMPPGSGKSYISLKLIEHFKIPTLILCDNCEEYWEEFIKLNTVNMSDDAISIYSNKNTFLTPITICSYGNAKETSLDILKEKQWGIIFYDDAHRALAPQYSKTLNIKSKYKFALAATLSRSDGKGAQLYDIIGPKLYNIQWQELKLKRFYKGINYTIIKSSSYDKITICKKIVNNYIGKNILICSYNRDKGDEISRLLNITYLNGNGKDNIKKAKERDTNDKFMNGTLNILCISAILQRIQISNIDVLIAITHNKGSQTEETFRIGRAVSCTKQLSEPDSVDFYSIVTEKEMTDFIKRLSPIEEYIKKDRKLINDTTFMGGDFQ